MKKLENKDVGLSHIDLLIIIFVPKKLLLFMWGRVMTQLRLC